MPFEFKNLMGADDSLKEINHYKDSLYDASVSEIVKLHSIIDELLKAANEQIEGLEERIVELEDEIKGLENNSIN